MSLAIEELLQGSLTLICNCRVIKAGQVYNVSLALTGLENSAAKDARGKVDCYYVDCFAPGCESLSFLMVQSVFSDQLNSCLFPMQIKNKS